jgi:hypothetical protein
MLSFGDGRLIEPGSSAAGLPGLWPARARDRERGASGPDTPVRVDGGHVGILRIGDGVALVGGVDEVLERRLRLREHYAAEHVVRSQDSDHFETY